MGADDGVDEPEDGKGGGCENMKIRTIESKTRF
jgi:hypothetical protein